VGESTSPYGRCVEPLEKYRCIRVALYGGKFTVSTFTAAPSTAMAAPMGAAEAALATLLGIGFKLILIA
jgi:hypothetical protein